MAWHLRERSTAPSCTLWSLPDLPEGKHLVCSTFLFTLTLCLFYNLCCNDTVLESVVLHCCIRLHTKGMNIDFKALLVLLQVFESPVCPVSWLLCMCKVTTGFQKWGLFPRKGANFQKHGVSSQDTFSNGAENMIFFVVVVVFVQTGMRNDLSGCCLSHPSSGWKLIINSLEHWQHRTPVCMKPAQAFRLQFTRLTQEDELCLMGPDRPNWISEAFLCLLLIADQQADSFLTSLEEKKNTGCLIKLGSHNHLLTSSALCRGQPYNEGALYGFTVISPRVCTAYPFWIACPIPGHAPAWCELSETNPAGAQQENSETTGVSFTKRQFFSISSTQSRSIS